MRKCYKKVGMSAWIVGVTSFLLSMFLRDMLNDFTLGFFEGMALAGMATGLVYLIACAVKRTAPFSLKDEK